MSSMSGYTKLFSSILMSSIWEEPADTRLVWVTLLALADQHGHVDGTPKSLARVARVSQEACLKALACFCGPDADDRSGVMDGQRIVAEQGGWRIVNHAAYRAKMSADERRQRDKIRKREARASAGSPQTSEIVRDVSQAEAEAEAEATQKPKTATVAAEPLDVAFRQFQASYPANRRKGGHLIEQAFVFEAQKAGGAAALMAALENHRNSAQWADPKLIPGLDTWLREERWRQRLDAPAAPASSKWPNWKPKAAAK